MIRAAAPPARAPLLVRPGARHACAGDGLCCTDAHVLGPVTRAEAVRACAIEPRAIVRNRALSIAALRTVGHDCVFLDAGGCRLHREQGALYKPATCRHFPLALVATPAGLRVTSDHRCPCRSLGDRPLLDEAAARGALTAGGERLVPQHRVGATVALAKGRRAAFSRYVRIEAELLDALSNGAACDDVLAEAPFPPLEGITWGDVGHHLRSKLDGTSAGDALAWGGDAILALLELAKPSLRARPWSPAFDRAEARAAESDAEAIFADWIADELWALPWEGVTTFDRGRAALATQLAIARWVAGRLVAIGTRADRAAAEGVLVGELSARSPAWTSTLERVAPR